VRLVAVAGLLLLASRAAYAGGPGSLGGILLLGIIILYVVPTLLFYAWLICFAIAAVGAWSRRRYRQLCVFGCLAALPVLLWAGSLATAYVANERHRAFLTAASALPTLPDQPHTLIIHADGIDTTASSNRGAWRQLVEAGAFDQVYITGPWAELRMANGTGMQAQRLVYARSPGCGAEAAHNLDDAWWKYRAAAGFLACAVTEGVDKVPAEGLHLYLHRQAPSRLSDIPLGWLGGGGPYELRLRLGDSDELVGYWEIAHWVWPVTPPAVSWTNVVSRVFVTDHRAKGKDNWTFLFERLGLDPDRSRPTAQPTRAEAASEFRRLMSSTDPSDRKLALLMVAALGSSLASKADAAALLDDDAMARILQWSFGVGFCRRLERLGEFKRELLARCRPSHGYPQDEPGSCQRLEQRIEKCDTPEGKAERALQ
jgi:hypothetical protein